MVKEMEDDFDEIRPYLKDILNNLRNLIQGKYI